MGLTAEQTEQLEQLLAEWQQDRWLTRPQLAERLQKPVGTIAQWAVRGIGPRYALLGRSARYRLSDVVAWERERAEQTGTAARSAPVPAAGD